MEYQNGKRYYTMSLSCQRRFGGRVVKIPLASGCTCPNRDGSRGIGGCSFCALTSPAPPTPLLEQYQEGCHRLLKKWPDARPVAYFQDFSNTHLPVAKLESLLEEAASLPLVAAIRLATRVDCLDREKVSLLAACSKARGLPIEVELGLQTVHDTTAARLNRGHRFEEFCHGHRLLREAGLYTCVHLINGLPGETAQEMLESARQLAAERPSGVKLHMLHLVKGTALAAQYRQAPFPLLSREEYAQIVARQLTYFAPDTVIERLTGDGAADALLAPLWTGHKRAVLNLIDQTLATDSLRQGDAWTDPI